MARLLGFGFSCCQVCATGREKMKFKEERPLAHPEIAMATRNCKWHRGRSCRPDISRRDQPCIEAVALGWLEAHPSGAYVKLTQKGG
jgi:hypothetical protein